MLNVENQLTLPMKFKAIYFLFLAMMFSCQNEPAKNGQAAENPATAEPTKNEANLDKLEKFVNGQLFVAGKEPVALGANENGTTLIMAPPAKTGTKSSSLRPEGLMKSDFLANTLANAKLEYIYCSGNAAMQTAMMTSRNNACSLGLLGKQSEEEFAKFILQNYAGKKVMVVAAPSYLNTLMEVLSGNNGTTFSEAISDQIYIANVKAMGDVEIFKFKY